MIKWYLISENLNSKPPTYGIVFHADVPDQQNAAGYSIRSQVKESMNPEGTAIPWLVGTQTETDMIAGLIYEQSVGITSFPGETLGQLQTRVDALATTKATELLAKLQASHYGHEHEVA